MARVIISVAIRSVITLPPLPQPSRRASRPSCTCGLREILLLFAVPSGSRWPYRASASRFLLQRAFRRRPWRLTRATVFVGNIPDCAQHQNHHFEFLNLSF
ncbi:hypothetical protein WFK86_17450, partial [Yersinia enterocolitica]